MAILTAWMNLQDSLCPKCGRPKALHDTQQPADFNVSFIVCPAMTELDAAQLEQHQSYEDKTLREAGLDPERGRSWFTWTDAEGPP